MAELCRQAGPFTDGRFRTRLSVVTSAILVLGTSLLPVLGADGTARAATTTAPAAVPASGSTVTLPTGEQVWGADTPGGLRVRTVAGRRSFITRRTTRGTFVVPAYALPYLGRVLDPELFNVSRAASGSAGKRIPVRISYSPDATSIPNLPGVNITSGGAGTAHGYLTPRSARAFGSALAARRQVGRTGTREKGMSMLAGVTRIGTDSAGGQVKLTPRFPMKTFIVKAVDVRGEPLAEGEIQIVNLEGKYQGGYLIENGEARASLPTGSYSAIASYQDDSRATSLLRVVPVNDFTITRQQQKLRLDFRKATVNPAVKVPKKADVLGYSLDWGRTGVGRGKVLQDFSFSTDEDTGIRVAPTPAAKVGQANFVHTWQLNGPATGSSYTYDLSARASTIPAKVAYTFRPADLATVTAAYYSDGSTATGSFVRSPSFGGAGSPGVLRDVKIGTRHTEYVGSKGGSALWHESALGNADPFAEDPIAFNGLRASTVRPGSRQSRAWFRGPLGANVPSQGSAGTCFGCRTARTMQLGFAAVADSTPDHAGSLRASRDGLPVTRLRVYRNGAEILDRDDTADGRVSIPAAAATYQAVIDVQRRVQGARLSTISQTALGFRSAKGVGGTLPSTWSCQAEAATSCRVLPILTARLALPTSLRGTVAGGKVKVTLTAAHIQYAKAAAVRSASLQVRFPGTSWESIRLTGVGAGRYTGVIDNAEATGDHVDLRIAAKDAGGSSFNQTVLRAYTVAAS
jgi:hypothetical protein